MIFFGSAVIIFIIHNDPWIYSLLMDVFTNPNNNNTLDSIIPVHS